MARLRAMPSTQARRLWLRVEALARAPDLVEDPLQDVLDVGAGDVAARDSW